MTRFVLAFCLVRSQWSGKVYLGVHYADGCAPECMGQAWVSPVCVCVCVWGAVTDPETCWCQALTWSSVSLCVVCLEDIPIFKMKIFVIARWHLWPCLIYRQSGKGQRPSPSLSVFPFQAHAHMDHRFKSELGSFLSFQKEHDFALSNLLQLDISIPP